MQYLIRLLSTLSLCTLAISTSHALDFSGSTVISSDVNDGLHAIGGVVGDTLVINSNVIIKNSVDLGQFPIDIINNGNIETRYGIQSSNDGNITNNGIISGGSFGIFSWLGTHTIINTNIIAGGNVNVIALGGNIIKCCSAISLDSYWRLNNINYRLDKGHTIINSGTISGTMPYAFSDLGSYISYVTIVTGPGDDTLILKTGSEIDGDIFVWNAGSFNEPAPNENDRVILQGSGHYDHHFGGLETLIMEGNDWSLNGNDFIGDILKNYPKSVLDYYFSFRKPFPYFYIPNTTISSGILRVNGMLYSTVTVEPNGTLGGNGIIRGDILNYGTIAPGNSIGTMTIAGDFIHNSNANLIIEFDNKSADQLIINGSTTLNNGSFTFVPQTIITGDKSFSILQSETINGQFGEIIKPAVFDIDLNIIGNTIQSTIKRNPYQSLAKSSNQKSLGSSLQDSLSTATGDLQNMMFQLDRMMTKQEVRAALDQLSPEPFAALPQVIFTESQLYTGTIARHLRGIQSSQTKTNRLQQLSSALTSGGNAVNASIPYAASADKGYDAFSSNGWQAYLQPYGIFSRLDSNSEFTGFNANTAGFAAGVDRRVSNSSIVGANLGWAYTDVAWHRAGTQAYIQTGRLSGYWGYQKDQWNLNGIVSYGYHHYDAQRRIRLGTTNRLAESTHDGHELSFSLNSAYSFQHNNWIFGPVASLQYTGLFEDSYNESGAGAAGFNFNGNDTHSLRSTLGMHAAVELDLGDDKTIVPAVQFGWTHEILDNQYRLNAQFQNSAGGTFAIRGHDLGNDSAYVAAGVTASLNQNTMLRLNYNADIGRTNYNNHMANLMLIMQF